MPNVPYHRDYWIAIAAAEPVIVLAYVVAITLTVRVVAHLIRADIRDISGVRGAPASKQALMNVRAIPRLALVSVLVAVSFIAVAACIDGFHSALHSLAVDRDTAKPGIVTHETVASLIYVLAFGAITAIAEAVASTEPVKWVLRKLRIAEASDSGRHD